MSNSTQFDIAVIGGGAAGMMAAASVLEVESESKNKPSVCLFEKNAILGQKVLISGGGRCNVTTGIEDIKVLLKKYPRGSRFLSYAMYEFSPSMVREWFEAHGVPLKREDDLRIFPVSDNGKDVVGVFEKMFSNYESGDRIEVHYSAQVTELIHHEHDEFPFELVTQGGDHIFAKKLILTTGGQAYRQTGSTGDGYAFAQKMGHTLTQLGPSLNNFFVQESWPKNCAGVSIEQANLTLKGTETWDFTGDFVFTHKGLSGPAIFALSAYSAFETISKQSPLHLTVDFFSKEKEDALAARFEKRLLEHPKKTIYNLVDMFLPKSLALAAFEATGIDGGKYTSRVSREERRKLVGFMKHAPLTIINRGAGEEFVTAGGIPTEEIEQKTMESKICRGLFFAGEIVNFDGFTGGFNLQASWATGRLAGISACTNH